MIVKFVCLECYGDIVMDTAYRWDGVTPPTPHNFAPTCYGETVPESDPRFAKALAKQQPLSAERVASLVATVQAAIDRAAHEVDVKCYGNKP